MGIWINELSFTSQQCMILERRNNKFSWQNLHNCCTSHP